MAKKDLAKLFTSTLLTYADLKLSKSSKQVYKIQAKANNSMDGVRQEVVPVKSCVESACKMREKERFRAVYYGDRAKNVLKLLYIILGCVNPVPEANPVKS
jgi:hypothetical protein